MKVQMASKSEIIAGLIKEEVFREAQRSGKLPSVLALAQRYGTSPTTICKSLATLEAQGYIESIEGSGTYLRDMARQAPEGGLKMVGVVEPRFVEGHSDFASHLTRFLQEEHYTPCLFDGGNSAALQAMLPAFLASNPAGLVVDGNSLFPYEVLARLKPSTRLVFSGQFEGPRHYDASYILFDFISAGSLGVRRLLRLGRRRIGVVNMELRPKWSSTLFWEGCQEAFREAGVAPVFHSATLGSVDDDKVDALLSGPERPDALLAIHDSRLLPFINSAKRLGLRVPEDLALIGGGDTDWAVKFDLSSVDPLLRETAIQTVAALGATEQRNCSIMPRITFRGSCPS